MTHTVYKAPFPWFGGKRRVADIVWERFGDVDVYAEPFFGSGAVLLGRDWQPARPRVETVNDLDGFVANAWRAIRADPKAVAEWADWPVNENDLHARHAWLVTRRASLTRRLEGDPEFYDPKIAGWWLWGMACWIGSGFCSGRGPWNAVDGQLVHLSNTGQGVNRKCVHLSNTGRGVNRKRVHLSDTGSAGSGEAGLEAWMDALSERLQRVRVCSGDWARIVTPSALAAGRVRGVFLDPPYSTEADRDMSLYAMDSGTVAHDVRDWCTANGDTPNMRIALCGYTGEGHDTLVDDHGWTIHTWTAPGGMSTERGGNSGGNNTREAIWFSPACLTPAQGELFT